MPYPSHGAAAVLGVMRLLRRSSLVPVWCRALRQSIIWKVAGMVAGSRVKVSTRIASLLM